MTSRIFKLFQRRLYDILSNKYYLLILLIVSGCLVSSLFLFGEAVVDWANHKYVHYIRLFEDNLVQSHLEKDLCAQLPIDIVYTWVNGSDPKLLQQLLLSLGKSNNQRFSTCRYINCIALHRVILIPALSIGEMALFVRRFNHSNSHNAIVKFYNLSSQSNFATPRNATIVHFMEGSAIFNVSSVTLDDKKFSINRLYVTSESISNGFVSPIDSYVIDRQQEKSTISKASLVKAYLSRSDLNAEKIMESDSGVLLTFHSENVKLQLDNNLNGNNSRTSSFIAKPGYLVWDFNKDDSLSGDFAPSRFQDNEELRFSLRSVEQYAPWVHHIFLLTNGQIPNWLNLANPRLTVVQHEDIFPNQSHLPTFSSPAIESHIHRIPGLSRFFLYFNDDVFLGKPITPSDFYSQSSGYKVYLSWSVPNCREDCPSNWLRDGYCDKACNYSECGWDEGDCLRSHGEVGYAQPGSHNALNAFGALPGQGMYHNQAFIPPPMCSAGCGDNWLGDRYCDMACNTADCAFDLGDCGDSDLDKLFTIRTLVKHSVYHFPPAISVATMDLKNLFQLGDEVTRGEFVEQVATPIRLISVAQKYKKLFILLKHFPTQSTERNATNNTNKQSSFTVSINLFGKSLNESERNVSLLLVFNSLQRNPEMNEDSQILTTVSSDSIPPAFTGYSNLEKYPYPAHENASHNVKSIQFGVTARPPTLKDRRLLGFLPWEKQGIDFSAPDVPAESFRSRQLLASYADSLKFTNRRLSHVYGHSQRKVPGHIPHFIDGHVMQEVQNRFQEDWAETSSHKVRSPEDIQFALTYYYYLMSEMRNRTVFEIISHSNSNNDSILDVNELYVIAVRMFNSPLSDSDKLYFNELISNCTSMSGAHYETENGIIKTKISVNELTGCEDFVKEITKRHPPVFKYKFEILGEDEIWFKMISSNASRVKHHLEEIIKSPRKFLCINDNLNHFDNESATVKQMLATFLHTLYPNPSQFELPNGELNAHLYIQDYVNDARIKKIRIVLIGLSIVIMLFFFCVVFASRFCLCRRRCLWRRRYTRLKKAFDA